MDELQNIINTLRQVNEVTFRKYFLNLFLPSSLRKGCTIALRMIFEQKLLDLVPDPSSRIHIDSESKNEQVALIMLSCRNQHFQRFEKSDFSSLSLNSLDSVHRRENINSRN